jgi:hypothetical protein
MAMPLVGLEPTPPHEQRVRNNDEQTLYTEPQQLEYQ